MLYTTYFAKLKQLPEDVIPISICAKAPEGYKGIQYKKLAPKYDFFQEWKRNHNNDYYIKCYNEQVLSKLNIYDVYNELYSLSNGLEFALVCYEKSDDFCHRHLVAEWFKNHNIKMMEWVT